MSKAKLKFKCDCGHLENEHNWDPWSSFFAVCEVSWDQPYRDADGVWMPDQQRCMCNRFRIDNLRFLEEMYAQRTQAGRHVRRRSSHV